MDTREGGRSGGGVASPTEAAAATMATRPAQGLAVWGLEF